MELSPVARLTIEWHGYLVASPDTHAWALDLYRAGEHHPEVVDDYFPIAHAPYAWLADAMRSHLADERRHDRMYTRAIERLGSAPSDVRGPDVFNVMIRECTPATFRIAADDSPAVRREKVAHFLAHAHYLEKRIARSLRWHVLACEAAGKTDVAKVVARVQADEARHAHYTREAVYALLPHPEAERILRIHRRGERRASALFNARQLKTFFARFPGRVPRNRAPIFKLAALTMERAANWRSGLERLNATESLSPSSFPTPLAGATDQAEKEFGVQSV